MKLKRLTDDDEEGDKKKKGLVYKVEEDKDINIDENMTLVVRQFKRFMNDDKQKDFQHKK